VLWVVGEKPSTRCWPRVDRYTVLCLSGVAAGVVSSDEEGGG